MTPGTDPQPSSTVADARAAGRLSQPRPASADQRLEAADSAPVFGTGVMTAGQWKGAVLGAVIGAVLGATLGTLLGLVWDPFDLGTGSNVLLWALCGALAVSTAGAIWGGGRLAEVTGEVGPLASTTPRPRRRSHG